MRERIIHVLKIYARMHKHKMDSRTLTLIGASLGGIGLALLVDARKQMSYLKAKQEEAVQEVKEKEPDLGVIVEAAPQSPQESEVLLKTEPVVPELPMPPPIQIPKPLPMKHAPAKPSPTVSGLVSDMLPGESYADYHRRIASFASEYKDESSEYDSSSSSSGSEGSEDYSDSDQDSEPGLEATPLAKSSVKTPSRLPPATPRQMAPREENARLVHRLRRATAMAEEEPETQARPSAKPTRQYRA
jgi:hypothetical protein